MATSGVRRRARELGLAPGALSTGPANAITDVAGVHVGHSTLDDGADVRTGVTAIVATQLSAERPTLPAGCFVGNGHGKLVGYTQLVELGTLETPIVLTATLSAFRAADAVVTHMLARPGYEHQISVNPVVGETNDGFLSDIRRRPVTEDHVVAAIADASPGPVEQGCVGAGTGTAALGFKAGIGSSSRVLAAEPHGPEPHGPEPHGQPSGTIGVLVQANFAGTLIVRGVPMPASDLLGGQPSHADEPRGNSCMIVVATDLALDARQLTRVARRAVFAMGRVGASFASGSGDYALAFSTADLESRPLEEAAIDPVFAAVMDAVEEALLDSLLTAHDTVGFGGHVRRAVPIEALLARLRSTGPLSES